MNGNRRHDRSREYDGAGAPRLSDIALPVAVRVELVYAATVVMFAYYFSLRHLVTPQWPPASFAPLVAGTAYTPMQYRVFVPWLVRLLRGAGLPGFESASLESYRLAIDLVSSVALIYATRWLLRRLGFDAVPAMLGSWMAALLLPYHFLIPAVTRYYPYDLPAIAFFALGLGLLAERKWRGFYPLFIVATLNRETTCFLTVIYVFAAAGREPRRRIAGHAAAQAAIWITIKLVLMTAYRANTSSGYALHFYLYRDRIADNLDVLRHPAGAGVFAILSMFGFLWLPVFALRRHIRHPLIERAIWVVPVYVAAMFYVGEMPELRIYGELIPLMTAAGLLIFANVLRAT